jgi:F-type H+-transporting ATPase subunit gamma
LIAIGRKGRDFFRRRRAEIVSEYVGLTGKGRVEFAEALEVAHDVIKRFTEDEALDKVFLIFNEFKSVLTQRVVVQQLLPISRRTENLFDEFIRALAEVSGVNNQQLEANKVAFIANFMLRTEFVTEYGSLNNQQYIDKLLQTAGVTLSSRQAMIDGLNNSTLTRAQVLRQIAESVEVRQKHDSPELKEYIYEQTPAEIFSRLLPRLVETQIFRALLESIASEQGARMTAMDAASKNAGELISSLTLNMNRVRQAAITREIIEIVSGAAAL